MVEDKEVIKAAAASALVLSAILLIFVSFGVAQLNAVLESGELEHYAVRIRVLRALVIIAGGTVILAVATAGVGMGWLLGATWAYDVAVGLFFAMLVLTALLALVAVGVGWT